MSTRTKGLGACTSCGEAEAWRRYKGAAMCVPCISIRKREGRGTGDAQEGAPAPALTEHLMDGLGKPYPCHGPCTDQTAMELEQEPRGTYDPSCHPFDRHCRVCHAEPGQVCRKLDAIAPAVVLLNEARKTVYEVHRGRLA